MVRERLRQAKAWIDAQLRPEGESADLWALLIASLRATGYGIVGAGFAFL